VSRDENHQKVGRLYGERRGGPRPGDVDGVGGREHRDRDDAAGSDIDDLGDDLMNLDDREKARRYARIILRTGDQLAEIESTVDSIVDAIGDDDAARLNDRLAD
jgi:plasmid stabilization system protein ParE